MLCSSRLVLILSKMKAEWLRQSCPELVAGGAFDLIKDNGSG